MDIYLGGVSTNGRLPDDDNDDDELKTLSERLLVPRKAIDKGAGRDRPRSTTLGKNRSTASTLLAFEAGCCCLPRIRVFVTSELFPTAFFDDWTAAGQLALSMIYGRFFSVRRFYVQSAAAAL
jgi:hypothetical protein